MNFPHIATAHRTVWWALGADLFLEEKRVIIDICHCIVRFCSRRGVWAHSGDLSGIRCAMKLIHISFLNWEKMHVRGMQAAKRAC